MVQMHSSDSPHRSQPSVHTDLRGAVCCRVCGRVSGWLLDGFPRRMREAEYLDAQSLTPNICILLDVNEEELFKRLTGVLNDVTPRFTCDVTHSFVMHAETLRSDNRQNVSHSV